MVFLTMLLSGIEIGEGILGWHKPLFYEHSIKSNIPMTTKYSAHTVFHDVLALIISLARLLGLCFWNIIMMPAAKSGTCLKPVERPTLQLMRRYDLWNSAPKNLVCVAYHNRHQRRKLVTEKVLRTEVELSLLMTENHFSVNLKFEVSSSIPHSRPIG